MTTAKKVKAKVIDKQEMEEAILDSLFGKKKEKVSKSTKKK